MPEACSRNGRGGVLLVGPLPPEPHTGGIEIGVAMLLRSPTARAHGMRLFNTARRRDPDRRLRERVAYQLGMFAGFIRAVASQRPVVVHVKASWGGVNFAQSIGYCALARLLGRRVLLQLHGGAFDTWYESRGRLAKTAVRLGMRSASEIVVLSDYWKCMVAALLPGKRIHVVPNGVEVANAVRATRSESREPLAVTIGTVGQRKGHFDIVRAAAELGDVPMRFAFAGPDETAESGRQLRALIDSLGVTARIELRGALGSAEKWRSLAEADFFLLPSHGENMPNSVLEAMAAELAIICSPVGAVPEMVEADTGAIYVPAGDHRAIAAAIRRLLANPELRRAMGAHNRRAVESRFAFDRIAERFDRLYRVEDGQRTSGRSPSESAT